MTDLTPPLLRLPKELRLQIYDYILSSHTVHIAGRIDPDLLAYQRRTLAQQGYLQPLARSTYTKAFHTLCSNGAIEAEAYSLSTLPVVPPTQRTPSHDRADLVLRSYHCRHKPCLDFISDYTANDYSRSLSPSPCDDDCRAFREQGRKCTHYARLLKAHGHASSGGLRVLHPASRLDLSLLLVNKQIYAETRLIPYARNTFDFTDLDVLWTFVASISPEQVSALGKIQLSYWTVGMLREARKSLPGLKSVIIDHSHPQSPESAYDRKAYLNYTVGQNAGSTEGVVERAMVFWSRCRGREEGWSGPDEFREKRREDAIVVERALMGVKEGSGRL
ncbi:unnamed protein product [Zymoseptoria tritici ST99CH_3D7]|uniref:Uncharacterized protein n=1 Tax=Zymoseptoria tritici (strain ST99CH_3D7) TaxID=1276538 RepID=A0A1X7S667_ZYMT9|nr:unnamed protein product [Zymoseptoria tritici ST99CH_3D7]